MCDGNPHVSRSTAVPIYLLTRFVLLASYALLLNSILTSFYICIGTFDGLVTFVGT
jgi:hypothetical protein